MTKNQLHRPCREGYVALGKMVVSPAAQRRMRPYRAAELHANFNPDRLGILAVNRRNGEDIYHCVDGQHRREALKRWLGDGWESQKVLCSIYEGLTEEEEADLWLDLNNTLAQSALDKFKVSLVAGRKREVEIAAVVEGAGLGIAGCSNGTGGIRCVGALYKVYERGGDHVLRRTIEIVRDAFGDIGFKALMLDGISLVVQRYGDSLDQQKAVAALQRVRGGAVGLVGMAEVLREKTRESKAVCIAAASVDVINRGKGKKLAKWWRAA